MKKRTQGDTSAAPQEPLVSVVIATRDRPEFLPRALRSLCRQLFTDFEVIIVNDGSIDPWPVIEPFVDILTIQYFDHEHGVGVSRSRNTALAAARGAYIAYLDDDDFYYEDHLNILVDALQTTGAPVVYSDANKAVQRFENGQLVTVSRRVVYSADFDPRALCRRNLIPTLCMMHEKHCLAFTGAFKKTLHRHEDWDLWLRMSRYYSFVHVPKATAEYTWKVGGESLSMDDEAMTRSRRHVLTLGGYLMQIPRVEDLALRLGRLRVLKQYQGENCPLSVLLYCAAFTPNIVPTLEALAADCPEGTEIMLLSDGDPAFAAILNKSIEGNVTIVEFPEEVQRVLACNQAAAMARGEHLLFVSADIVPWSGCLTAMLAVTARHKDACIVGACLGDGTGALSYGGSMSPRGALQHQRDAAPDPGSNGAWSETACVSAHCMLVSRTVFTDLGGFSLRYAPMYYEDADLCFRAREAGIPSYTAHGAVALWPGLSKPAPLKPGALYNAAGFTDQWAQLDAATEAALGEGRLLYEEWVTPVTISL